MPNRKIAVCFGFAFLALLISGTTATSVAADTKTGPAETGAAQITILYDAFGKPSAMRKDWGFSAYVEYGGKRDPFRHRE